ncbi:MAG TPA: glycosyltransferase [Bacteroidia bacterium]|jgi:glycosyltransferase involved in cell wall biosynthesis|nr:glycosyltransferase [Bacteroidia bacterium]
MKLLYISYDGMTDPLGQSQVIPYLIGLSTKNKITIISCEKTERYEQQKDFIQSLLNKHHIHWIPVPYSKLPSVFSKQWNIARIKNKAVTFCKKEHPEAVHCRSYMAGLVGLFLKEKFNLKFIFDMRGFWADERIDGNIWSKANFIHKRLYTYFKKKEIEFLKNADYTISLTQNAKEEILSWPQLKGLTIPIQVIPCCADLEHFSLKKIQAADQHQLKSTLGITDQDFVISYLGSIGTWYLLDEMLDFFSCLQQRMSNAKFLFITPDNKNHILERAKLKQINPQHIIIQAASRKQVPLYLSLSTISIYFIKPSYSKKASSPTKTAEILALGIPIITNTGIGDSTEILEKSGTGLLISAFNPNNYNQIINQFSLLLSIDKQKMIDVSEKYFSLEKGVELYQSVYSSINNIKH